nr:hypothetical protein BaRGS_027741 [Batillaria attramentaria]
MNVALWTYSYVLSDSPKLICHTFTGRLGNEMFQYASILAIAHANNRTPVLIGSEQLDKVLRTPTTHPTKQMWLEARCVHAEDKRSEHSCCTFNPDLLKISAESDCVVDLYFQSWKYFQNYDAEIREALTFTDSIREEASEIVTGLKQEFNGSTLIGIHVRKGDLIDIHNIKIGYPIVSEEFLNRTVEYFHKIVPDPVFVVASDSIMWCKLKFPADFVAVYLENHSPAVDLSVLASLDHVAVSFGSFSWWAAYLNPGKVVYLKELFTGVPNSTIGKDFGPNVSVSVSARACAYKLVLAQSWVKTFRTIKMKWLMRYRWTMKKSFLLGCVAGSLISTTLVLHAEKVTTTVSKAWESFFMWSYPFVLDEYPKLICHYFTGRLGNEMFQTVNYFENLFPKAVFIVASDSVRWCKANFPPGHTETIMENHSPAVDLLVLASLDHVAISFGSYSWWAGYLNQGKVVYVKNLITGVPNTSIGNTFGPDGKDFIYPTWTAI